MIKRSLNQAFKDFLKIWNQEFFANYPLTERLFEERILSSSDLIIDSCYALYSKEEFVAIIILKRGPKFDLKAKETAFISLLYVNPKYRHKKIGEALVLQATEDARKINLKYILTGCDYNNLFSGVFTNSSKLFFEKLGFIEQGKNYNLIIKSTPYNINDSVRLAINEEEKQLVLDLIQKSFSKRWYYELKDIDPSDLVMLFLDNKVIGFARIADLRVKVLPNSLTFYSRYDNLGGLGPLGIDPSYQGQGLGRILVENAVRILFEKGVSEVLVDWTGLLDFYQKCGFRKIVDEFIVYLYIL